MFGRYDDQGKLMRHKGAVIDCSNDTVITEQSHKLEVDINQIVKRHGVDLIAQTALLQSSDFTFDEIPGNDFQEAMLKVTRAQQSFDLLPSKLRKQFNNNPAEFLDYVQDPANADSLVELGLAERLPVTQPVEVVITNPPDTNPETPPA